MKVVQINSVYKIASTGRTSFELCSQLERYNHVAITACKNSSIDREHTIQIGNGFDYKIHALLSRITGKPGYYSKRSTKKFLRELDQIKPDIVHLRNLHSNYINIPMLLKYLGEKDIATVITLHDCFLFTGKCVHPILTGCTRYKNNCGKCKQIREGNKSWFFDRTQKMLNDKKLLFSNISRLAVVGVSNWVTSQTNDSILDPANIKTTIYNWIDESVFKPCLGIKEKFNSTVPIILGVASHWEKSKGYDEFCEIASRMGDDIKVVLVGNVPDEKKVSNIYYVGEERNPHKLAELYSLATVFLNPTKMETFGKVSAEALACGTPVVAYDVTANKEIIGDKCGYIVEQGNMDKIVDAINCIITNGKDYYSSSCVQHVKKNFNMNSNVEKYMEIYDKLIELKEEKNG